MADQDYKGIEGLQYPENGTKLFQEDFNSEQSAIGEEVIDRESDLFSSGIIEGFGVSVSATPGCVDVEAGKARDPEGRRITGTETTAFSVPDGQTVKVIVRHLWIDDPYVPEGGVQTKNLRRHSFEIDYIGRTTDPEDDELELALVSRSGSTITVNSDLRTWISLFNLKENELNKINAVLTKYSDDIGQLFSKVTLLFPWESPNKLSDPSTLPTGTGQGVAWSPNGKLLAVSHTNSPHLTIYQRNGTILEKLTDPADLPGNNAYGVAWSPDGKLLAVVNALGSIALRIYEWNGESLNKLSDPATLPPNTCYGVAWSPNGEFLAVACWASPFIIIYQRDDTTFTKIADPAVLPTGMAYGVAWSPNGKFLVISHSNSPYITIYQREDTTFTKLANPISLPSNQCRGMAWSPDGELLAVGQSSNPGFIIYKQSGTTFTKLSNYNISSLPSGTVYGVIWSPDGELLAVVNNTSPYIHIYQRHEDIFEKLSDPSSLPTSACYSLSWTPNIEFLAIANDNSPYITVYQTSKDMPDKGIMIISGERRAGT